MRKPQPITDHRLARLTLRALAILVWAAGALFGNARANRRHIRQRYGALSLGKLTHMVRDLLLIRAARFQRAPLVLKHWRIYAQPGLHRRKAPRNKLRSIAGGRLRRFMNHGSLTQRLARLIQIVRNLDIYARRFMLRRVRNGVTRLLAIGLTHPSQEILRDMRAPKPLPADSS